MSWQHLVFYTAGWFALEVVLAPFLGEAFRRVRCPALAKFAK